VPYAQHPCKILNYWDKHLIKLTANCPKTGNTNTWWSVSDWAMASLLKWRLDFNRHFIQNKCSGSGVWNKALNDWIFTIIDRRISHFKVIYVVVATCNSYIYQGEVLSSFLLVIFLHSLEHETRRHNTLNKP
jgi:hypothetical protein